MTCKRNWFLFNARELFGKSFPDYTSTDWSLFLSPLFYALCNGCLPWIYQFCFTTMFLSWHPWLLFVANNLLWYTRVTSVKWKKNPNTHTDTKNRQTKNRTCFLNKSPCFAVLHVNGWSALYLILETVHQSSS